MSENTIELNVFDMESLWEQRQSDLQAEEESFEGWQKLSEETRDALVELVDQALQKMRENKDWVPYSLEIEEGSVIDVKIRILFSDITDEIVKRRAVEQGRILEARDDTAAMIDELEGEGKSEGDEPSA